MDEKLIKENLEKMRRVKQVSINSDLPELTSVYSTTRIYQINDILYSREEFIKEVALCIYDNEPQTNIRETIDFLLKDDMKELVCSGGKIFVSYLSNEETNENVKHSRKYNFDGSIQEERPLKSYEVSYDVVVQPLIPSSFSKKRVYKRVTEVIAATRFKEAKELIRKRTHDEGKTTKSYEVVEVKLSEGVSVR